MVRKTIKDDLSQFRIGNIIRCKADGSLFKVDVNFLVNFKKLRTKYEAILLDEDLLVNHLGFRKLPHLRPCTKGMSRKYYVKSGLYLHEEKLSSEKHYSPCFKTRDTTTEVVFLHHLQNLNRFVCMEELKIVKKFL